MRHGLAGEDPRYAALESFVATQPTIRVPTIILVPLADGLGLADYVAELPLFVGGVEARELTGVGHNAPQEAPAEFARAVLGLRGAAS